MGSPGRPDSRLLCAIFLTALGTSFPFGFHLGVINITQSMFEAYVNSSWDDQNAQFLDSAGLDSVWSGIVSSFTLGGALGGLSASIAAERLGRKGGLLLAAGLQLVACGLLAGSKAAAAWEVFAVGRTVGGFACGLGSCLLSIFLSEISPKRFRGFSGAFLEVFLVLGKLSSLVLSLPSVLGRPGTWAVLVSLPAAPALLLLSVLPFMPESPNFIRARKGTTEAVKRSLRFYRGSSTNTRSALSEIDHEIALMDSSLSFVGICRDPLFRFRSIAPLPFPYTDRYRRTLVLGLVVRLGQELTGITAIFNFSTGIFRNLHFAEGFSEYNSIGIAAMSAVVTTCAVFAVERLGRRPLLVYGLLGTLICDCAFLLFAELGDGVGPWAGYVCVGVLYVHVFVFSAGPGPVGWLVVPEFSPQQARAGVTSAGVFINWFSNLLVTAAFLPLKAYIGHYSFLMFIIPLGMCIAYLWRCLPETRDRSVEDISADIMRGRPNPKEDIPLK